MRYRCTPGSYQQRTHPTYIGCKNGFPSFNAFVEWHREQPGYCLGHEIDKDLLVKGNKVYGLDTCCLIPREINMMVQGPHRSNTGMPVGVYFDKVRGNYQAQCGGSNKLGRHPTAESAFAAYKVYKEAKLKELAEKWKDTLCTRAYEALMNYEVTPYY